MEKKILEGLVNDGLTHREMSSVVGKSPTTIRYWMAKYGIKSSPRRRRKKRKDCIVCGNEVNRNASKYCSMKCFKIDSRNKYIKRWLSGKESGKRGSNWQLSSIVRNYLFTINNNKCQKCGWGEIHKITKKPPLQVNHIDGDFKNNTFENLELLCPNCHSLTPNFGALNTNGRRSRGCM
jgi:endogenous inhibitor of DNA gyrase (YacG/DUF329 family)